MKTRTSSLLALLPALVAFVCPQLSAAPKPLAPARAHPVKTVEQRGEAIVTKETREFAVRRLLGEPTRKLDQNTWVYYGYSALPSQDITDDRNVLIVTFAKGVVSEMSLANESAVRVVAANLREKNHNHANVASR